MSGDYSRQRFDPKNDFCGVLMQQGRVQLDADWNEFVEILDRRWRAETTDIIGRCVVPRQTPQGFLIGLSGGNVTIGRGRIYVDGLLAENEGQAPLEFDSVLAEERGTQPLPYLEQPYLPDAANVAPPPDGGGPHLFYVDVWQREVTSLERPDLVEPAVGVDTTNRLQTVWQGRWLPLRGNDVTCATPDDQIPAWQELIAPSAGRLSTQAIGVLSPADPCLIPPSGGYRGLENRLYRVEVHDPGPIGTATFKWSRDNASIATAVTALLAPNILKVARVGHDAVLRFNPGDWVEVLDDRLELAGRPGIIRQVQDVDDDAQTLTLTATLPAGEFPANAQGQTEAARHTRVKRWDQGGRIEDTNGNLLVDLDAPGSTGVIPVPAAGTSLVLEDGVQITFDVATTGGQFRVGDYWVFAARTADASVEELQKAPPRGIHHHYGRLAIVTFPNSVTDCRVLWPTEVGGDTGCDCSVCVTPESHNSGALTIQRAIDEVKETGGTVCLGAGQYRLGEEPIRFIGASSVRFKGQGWKTQLIYNGSGPAIQVERSRGVTIEEFMLLAVGLSDGNPVMSARNTIGFTMRRCVLLHLRGGDLDGPAIGIGGYLLGAHIRENALVAAVGLGNVAQPDATGTIHVPPVTPLISAELCFDDNFLFCRRRGVSLEGMSLHTGETRVAGNFLLGCAQGGIVARGWTAPGSSLGVQRNELRVTGPGIVVGVDGARICDNDISAPPRDPNTPPDADSQQHGILLTHGLAPGASKKTGLKNCRVQGNTVRGVGGHGIALRAPVESALIENNIIEEVGGSGIAGGEEGQIENVTIRGNRLRDVARRAEASNVPALGIHLLRVTHADVSANVLRDIGREAAQSPLRCGIHIVSGVSVRVAGNDVHGVGPVEFVRETTGIEVSGPFASVEIADNIVRPNSPLQESDLIGSRWLALRVQGVKEEGEPFFFPIVTPFAGNFALAGLGELVYGFFGASAIKFSRTRGSAGIHDNVLEARGETVAVDLGGSGAFLFNANRCRLASRSPMPVVSAEVGAMVVNANFLQGTPEAEALRLQTGENAFTIVGNVSSGPLIVNGAPLNPPWAPLNVIAF